MNKADGFAVSAPESIFQSNLPLATKLERARMELLDLSARNRLLNIPRSSKSTKIVEVIEEKTSEVYRLLVKEGRTFTFLPGRSAAGQDKKDGEAGAQAVESEEEVDEVAELEQPIENAVDEQGVLIRHTDTKLQTRLTSKGLQKRLLDLYFDARTLEEEQGVNILFLSLGTLKWVDPKDITNIRYAPLILVPVSLERGSAGEKFKLKWRQEDQAPNLSLEAYLDRVHTLKLPPFDQGDEFDPAAYLAAVAEAVSLKQDWKVMPDDMVLGFFSFSKFLMYRDLDPEVWPENSKLTDQSLVRSLLADGFPHTDGLIPEDASIDQHIAPQDMVHIVDSDSSQTLAVHDVRAGRNLVIQGPPGTGKSQTIANVIASAVADGKTVLFVAEKMAALDVVKRRLDRAGVGDACLELHSNKTNKRVLLEELRRTWELGAPQGDSGSTLSSRLQTARDELNSHASRMHVRHSYAGLTPYQVVGQLTRLRQGGHPPASIRLEKPENWSIDDLKARETLISEIAERVDDIGLPKAHPWRGIGLQSILPIDLERLVKRISGLLATMRDLEAERVKVAADLKAQPAVSMADFEPIASLAKRVAGAPDLTSVSFAATTWSEEKDLIELLIKAGLDYAKLASDLTGNVTEDAWTAAVEPVHAVLAKLPASYDQQAILRVVAANELLPRQEREAEALKALLGRPELPITTIAGMKRVITVAERVAAAPDASPEALTAAVWDHGIEQAEDLAGAVATLELMRAAIAGKIVDECWDTDLAQARHVLLMHGTSLFRFFNGEWRRANRLVKSLLVQPDLPLNDILVALQNHGKGRGALAEIVKHSDFGRAAFGPAWRGERSASEPLQVLVSWMRSVRSIGPEPRMIAAKMPDRAEIGMQAARTKRVVDEATVLLEAVWRDLGAAVGSAFGDAINLERAELAPFKAWAGEITQAKKQSDELLAVSSMTFGQQLTYLKMLIDGQKAAAAIAERDALGQTTFDAAWAGKTSDWVKLAVAAKWVGANGDIRLLVSEAADRVSPDRRAEMIGADQVKLAGELGLLLTDIVSSVGVLFGHESLVTVPITELIARLASWVDHAEQLSKWVIYCERRQRGNAMGIGQVIDGLDDGDLASDMALPTFQMAYYEALFGDQVRAAPELAQFDGQSQSRLVQQFSDLDRQRITASALEVVRAHHRRIPPQGGGVGPVGVLRSEMARRRGLMPIRQLMLKAAPAIQALKPVLMMSPLSVAQFLPPGLLTFDLLVMDEASQIQPVDAIGAIARCRQVVVVGDERQLPPTKFFAKMTGGQVDDDDSDEAQVADIESILGLFTARGLPQRMLRWHYRSRHQSLIAVSNSQFYDSKLFIVPSPYTQDAGMGLRFNYVDGGIFDSGNTGINAKEAKVVAEAIIKHALTQPNLSLGVATFSVKQRRAIQDQLEILRRLNPETETFFHSHPSEPFFVKNLENVQGDERDVILISVGYGKNAQGYMAMRFGPLSADGGERRLNVLISRAKRRCEVFASITDEDIDLERGRGKGVFAFKLFLHFARTGHISMAQKTERGHDTMFEEQVAKALQDAGYQVHSQVGMAGFFIDLAIADATRPGRYILGIECDGASYHSSKSARDRDRLRQAVLEDHGWIIHRIWSTDWFQRPREQLERVISAIEAGKVELDAREKTEAIKDRAVPIKVVTIERADSIEIGLVRTEDEVEDSNIYEEAKVERPRGDLELHEVPVGLMADLVEKIVTTESPVHIDEVVVRVRTAWGLLRAGGRIQSAVEQGVWAAVRAKKLAVDDRVLTIPGKTVRIRDRRAASSPSLRRPEYLPPAEIRAGILGVVKANLGGKPDEIVLAVSRAFGFQATSTQIRDLIKAQIDALVKAGNLIDQAGLLVLNDVLQTA